MTWQNLLLRVTLRPSSTIVPRTHRGPGVLSRYGVIMRPCRGDRFITTAEAARMVGVSKATIRKWRSRGWLTAQGLDERNRPLHTREAVRAAERRVRENGLRESGIDPRQLRHRAA